RVDLRGWGVPAGLCAAVGDGTGHIGRPEPQRPSRRCSIEGGERRADPVDGVPPVQGSAADATAEPRGCAVVLRLDPPLDARRFLAAIQYQGPLPVGEGAGAALRGLV